MSTAVDSILIQTGELQEILAAPALLILDATVELATPRFDGDYDARSGYEGWLQGHIPGALHADLYAALSDPQATFSFALPNAQALAAALGSLGIGDQRRIVIYDRNDGFWAARLWWVLRSVGLHAQVLDGGFKAWQRAGLPQEVGPVATQPVIWQTEYRDGFWIDRAGVQSVLAGERPGTLVCALSAGLFDGSAVSRYARRGHIPDSLNLPARTLFDEQGRYLEADALREALDPLLESEEPLILYCGGGISAAAQALALTLLGRSDVFIYDGSLQEWAADPRLPMTTGAAPA
ncbi:rhodanese-like domain-containing protein [Pseudomonas sp. KFB-139]|uniref:Rhodanese-like domain-containing protein n=1 Tax=Pseudomonas serbiensis TaxID=3064350 RepID=A0ABT9CRB6_9PSED|nr:rhodanese-like domain-containing protein [Pseudomonas sp. KFB-138]MDO7928047.1 rhodanese-like domain-containing protein [Pseudomonas sp. KFB-138]